MDDVYIYLVYCLLEWHGVLLLLRSINTDTYAFEKFIFKALYLYGSYAIILISEYIFKYAELEYSTYIPYVHICCITYIVDS